MPRYKKPSPWSDKVDWTLEPDAAEVQAKLVAKGAKPPLKFIRLNDYFMIFDDARGVGCSYNRILKTGNVQKLTGSAIYWTDGTAFRGWIGDNSYFVKAFPRHIVFPDNSLQCDECSEKIQ